MDPSSYASASIHAARNLKETIVKRDGPGTELLPMFGLWRDGVCLGYLLLTVERGTVLRVFREAIPMTGADMVQHVHESYEGGWPEGGGPGGDVRPGTLGQLFKAGDPHVREVVWCLTATATTAIGASMPYEYGPGRTVRWLDGPNAEPRELPALGGAHADALAEAWANPVRSSMPLVMVGLELGMPVFTWWPTAPPRNEPCPCGSGQKAKRCCWR
jgi:hypothetical protein